MASFVCTLALSLIDHRGEIDHTSFRARPTRNASRTFSMRFSSASPPGTCVRRRGWRSAGDDRSRLGVHSCLQQPMVCI